MNSRAARGGSIGHGKAAIHRLPTLIHRLPTLRRGGVAGLSKRIHNSNFLNL